MLNCYQVPAGQGTVMIDFKDILEKDSHTGLHKMYDRILTNPASDGVIFTLESYYGFLYEGVETITRKYKTELVVIGTTGASTFTRRIFGSNTSHLIKRLNRPILAIPAGATWRNWNHTIIAADYSGNRPVTMFTHLKKLTNGMPVSLDVLHVIDKPDESSREYDKIESRFIAAIGNTQVNFHYEPAESIVEGILNYTQTHECDVLVMLRRKYNFIEQLFHSSATQHLTLHTKNPILLLPE